MNNVRPEMNLFWVWRSLSWLLCGWWWSKLTRFLDEGRKSLGSSVSIELTWFCLGGRYGLDLSVGDRTRLDFCIDGYELICLVSGGRKRLGFSVWIKIYLDFVWWCSTANGCLGHVLEDHSVTVNWVAQWFILHIRPDSNASQVWLSNSVVHPSCTNSRGLGFKSYRSRRTVFSEMHFFEIHLHTTARS